jgi:RNA polymerase sigma-70 factor, ECF subfamily
MLNALTCMEDSEMSVPMMMLERETVSVAPVRRADQHLDLLEALRRREPSAAERLVATFGNRAYRLAANITGSGQDAEEVVQDAFWSVVRKIDSFRGESAFGSWLYRIVANAAYQKRRARQNRSRDISWDEVLPVFDEQSRHALPMTDWSPRVNDPSVQTELRMALTAAIDQLPAAYRTVLVLRDVQGLSNAEIAALLGLTIPVVKTRVHRGRLFLRKQLGEAMATLDPSRAHEGES